jgi:hypothetical protein
VNGDGVDDLIVGAYRADPSGKISALVLSLRSAAQALTIKSSKPGDVNGDGLDDLIIGAIKADASGASDAGKSYVVFGKQDNATINTH